MAVLDTSRLARLAARLLLLPGLVLCCTMEASWLAVTGEPCTNQEAGTGSRDWCGPMAAHLQHAVQQPLSLLALGEV